MSDVPVVIGWKGDRDRKRDENGRIKLSAGQISLIIAVIGAIFSAWMAMNARVSVLESQYQQMHGDIQEIRTDVKTLLGRR